MSTPRGTPAAQAVFADTGYWLGLLNHNDPLRERVQRAAVRYASRQIITSELVLVELMDGMARRGPYSRRQAVELVKEVSAEDSNVEVVPLSQKQFQEATERYAARLDQRWSLTDCASFLIMESRGIWQALAHDRDFVQAGFIALLRDD